MTVDEALKILRSYSCIESKIVTSATEKFELRQALLLITELCEWQNFGICADNSEEGFVALISYLKALGYQHNCDFKEISQRQEPIYLKFNSQRMAYFIDVYEGKYRGVLVSCQSTENSDIVGTYGHLPLDLFSE